MAEIKNLQVLVSPSRKGGSPKDSGVLQSHMPLRLECKTYAALVTLITLVTLLTPVTLITLVTLVILITLLHPCYTLLHQLYNLSNSVTPYYTLFRDAKWVAFCNQLIPKYMILGTSGVNWGDLGTFWSDFRMRNYSL